MKCAHHKESSWRPSTAILERNLSCLLSSAAGAGKHYSVNNWNMFIFGFFVLLASIPSGAFDFNSIDIFEPATTAAFSMVGDISHSMEEFYDALETEKEDEHSPMLEDRRLTTTSAPPDSGAAASSGGTGVPLVSGKDYPEALLIVVSVLSALAFGASLLQLWLTVKIRMALLETRKIKEARWPEEDLQANDVEMGL